jgi:hypothetical protein
VENESTEIPLRDITLDQRLQPRAALDVETVEDYAARYSEGADMPAVTLFHDGGIFWLADGFTRVAAAGKAGRDTISADVREGTYRDALLFAAAANAAHGLRRTNADKRRAVAMLLADPECAGWPDREIARHCRVGAPLVGEVRAHLKEITDRPAGHLSEITDTPTARTVTRNGVTYTMNTTKIGKRRTAPQEAASTGPRLSLDDMPETNENGLLACPFCGTGNVDLIRPPDGYLAKCLTPDCGVSGPRTLDVMDAQDAWNRRKGPGKYEATHSNYQ